MFTLSDVSSILAYSPLFRCDFRTKILFLSLQFHKTGIIGTFSRSILVVLIYFLDEPCQIYPNHWQIHKTGLKKVFVFCTNDFVILKISEPNKVCIDSFFFFFWFVKFGREQEQHSRKLHFA